VEVIVELALSATIDPSEVLSQYTVPPERDNSDLK
jgi:hypothetical protein